jgi:predicted outer membrane repeat protein
LRILKLTFSSIVALGLLLGLSVLITLPPVQAEPAATLQALIDAAPAGGTVNIAAGVYTESLTVNKTLTLTGVSSTTTIIQAMTGQRAITVMAGNNLRLEKLTVTGGQTNDAGGGILLANGSLTLINCRIISNSAAYGGGIFQEGTTGRVDVIGSQIESNTTVNHGGGLYVRGSVAFTSAQVLSNTATFHGGGAHVETGLATVSGGVWRANRAGRNGGAINSNGNLTLSGTAIISNTAQNGGGVQQWNTMPTVLITNTRFERNVASSSGGGAAISGTLLISNSTFATNTVDSGNSNNTWGGGLYAYTSTQIFASTFSGNSAFCLYGGSCGAANGGGIFDRGANMKLTNVIFKANKAGRLGGGMASESSNPVLLNVIFSGNEAGWGGGLHHVFGSPLLTNVLFSGNNAGWAGGMLAENDNPTLKQVTFSGNDGYNQGGALLNSYSTPTVINSILWGNTATNGPEIYNSPANLVITITYSDIRFTGVYTGVGNVNVDPRFVSPITYTAAPTTTGNYHLKSDSPVIDQGTNSGVLLDLEGWKRPIGLGYDMGAYEVPLSVFLPVILR